MTPMGMKGPRAGAEAEAQVQRDQVMEEAGIIIIEAAAGVLRGMIGTVHLCAASIRQ